MLPTVVYVTFILIPPLMNPMDFARGLLSPDGSMRSEQDRQVNLCILQHIPRRYHIKTLILIQSKRLSFCTRRF